MKTMKTITGRVVVLVLLLSVTACTPRIPSQKASQDINFVTVAEIRASLPLKPIVVGFDIDDTVLFSSPGFHYGLKNQDGPGGKNLYGADPLHSKKFWNDMNGWFDKFSLPKKSGRNLVQMHYKRGDKLVFITARNSSERSIVSQILAQSLSIPEPEVIFTSGVSKTDFMRKQGVSIYYGDADSDMQQAKNAKVRPVRVIRSALSTNNASADNIGAFGEEVVINSEN